MNKEPQETHITTDVNKLIEFLINATAIEGPIKWCDCKNAELRVVHAADAILAIIGNSIIKAFETLEIRKIFLMEYIANSELKNYCNLDKVARVLEIESRNKNLH